jgi:2-iminobutanoate/2-iminopropanoate deaminase
VGIDHTGKLVGKGDAKAQALQALENIKAVLEAEGSEPKDIVKLTVYMKNIEDYAQINEARAEFFKNNSITEENYPASTAVEARLVLSDFLVEIEAVALVE